MKKSCLLVLVIFFLGMSGVLRGEEEAQTLSGFSVPEYDKNGKMTSQLFGDLAEVLPDGRVKITNLKIEFYGKDGGVIMRVTSPHCVFYRRSRKVTSNSSVRIARSNMIVTGEGFEWDSKDQRLKIFSNSKLVLKNVREHIQTGDKP